MKRTPPPAIDGRRRAELLEEAVERARSYTPEWDPDAGDVGTALLHLFADISADVVTRLDRVPEKHRVAFFDELGFDRAPPQPARLPLVFQVVEGYTENVRISAGTQAVAPPEGKGTEQVFEITADDAFEATPARLDAVYSVSPAHDAIFEHQSSLEPGDGTQLFTGTNTQEHVFYLGHTDFFTLTPTTEFEVRIEGDDVGAFETLRWEYYGAALIDDESVEGWHPLPRRPRPETSDDAVTLRFKLEEGSEFVETTLPVDEETDEEPAEGEEPPVTAIETRWIRCVSPASLDEALYATSVSSVSFSLVGYGAGPGSGNPSPSPRTNAPATDGGSIQGLEPDMLLANDVPLPTAGSDERVYPFGEMPIPLDAFYIASDEAFSKKEHTVRLWFEGMRVEQSDSKHVDKTVSISPSWEYWNGSGWAYLDVDDGELWKPTTLPSGATETVPEDRPVDVRVPADAEATAVSGHEHYWIRIRFPEDGYVRFEEFKKDEVWEMLHEAVPSLTRLYMDYPDGSGASDGSGNGENGGNGNGEGDGNGNGEGDGNGDDSDDAVTQPTNHPQYAVTRNNSAYGPDETRALKPGSGADVQPFGELPDSLAEPPNQTLYLGFDGPLDDGPIQLLFSAVDKTYPVGFYPRARWEYRVADPDDPADDEWEPLSVEDGTEGLTRRGIVGLVFPEETTASERFGRTRHWVRARLVGESQFDVVVNEGAARDVPESDDEGAIRIAVDAERGRTVLENTTDQAFGLSGYSLLVGGARHAFSDESPGASVLPPSGTLVVEREPGTDGSGGALETPTGEALFGGNVGEATEDGATSRTAVAVGGRPLEGAVAPCEALHPAVLATSPQWTTLPPKLRARGIYPNAGWADNVRTVAEEVLGSSDGAADQTFSFANQPAIDETVWVDELSTLDDDEREALTEDDPETVDERTDDDGDVTAFWVQWTPVENFVESTADDRHYVVDRTEGRLTFGDGTRGAIPPIGENNVTASYRTGGGVDGNVQAETVAALVTALPYVDGVTNPEAGGGGADAEQTASAVERAARTLRDRDRAVTAADFERLAMSASRELARARCIPGMDREGAARPGWVTVLLVPRTSEPKPTPSPEVRRRVEERLWTVAPAPVTQVAPDQVVVRGPSYLGVLVETTLVVTEGTSSVAAVEKRAIDRLEAFLHPLTGGPDGDGWAFGDLPCLSEFYALLERVEGVDRVSHLAVTFRGRDRDHVVASDEDELPQVAADTLVFSESHDVQAGGDTDAQPDTDEATT